MAKVRVKLNFKGMGDLLKSPEIAAMLQERMARVQSALPGSRLETRMRRSRVAAVVIRGSDFDEANTGDLSRALDLAGGLRGTQVKTQKPRRGA
jgi:hypothetical protein